MPETEKLDPLPGWEFGQRLVEAGVIGPDVRRCVIDVPADGIVMIYVERIGSRKLLDVVTSLKGVQIKVVDAEAMSAFPAAFPAGCPQPREDRCCLLSTTRPPCAAARQASSTERTGT